MSETKIKPSQIDVNWDELGGGPTGFIVREDSWEDYKVDYYSGGEVLDLSALITDAEIPESQNGNRIINLNGYTGVFDSFSMDNENYVLKNGTVIFDNPTEGGCGNAIQLSNNSSLEFDNCEIRGPLCGGGTGGILNCEDSQLNIVNSHIDVAFTEDNKSLIELSGNGIFYMGNSWGSLTCADELDNSNIGFNFITVKDNGQENKNNCNIQIRNCQVMRMANDHANQDVVNNFIKSDTDVTFTLGLFNNVIWMQGHGDGRVLNINLDNQNCSISNNDLQGILEVRYESTNTVTEKFVESGGSPVTFNQGDEVWNLYLVPRPANDIAGIIAINPITFAHGIGIALTDMTKLYNTYNFTWKNIDDQSGFIFQYNDQETYTTSDLISMANMESTYGIILEDTDTSHWTDGDYINVFLSASAQFQLKNIK